MDVKRVALQSTLSGLTNHLCVLGLTSFYMYAGFMLELLSPYNVCLQPCIAYATAKIL